MTSPTEEIQLSSYLDGHADLQQKIRAIRSELQQSFPFIHRIAIALYNPECQLLKTHVYDEDIPSNLHNYEAILPECSSLNKLALTATQRVSNDISAFPQNAKTHTHLVREAGYLSSVTIPLLMEGELLGFLFVNSREVNVFTEETVQHLRMLSMVLTLLLHRDLARLNVLKSTIESMKVINLHKDPETGEHLQRMASYSLLIAKEIAHSFNLSDDFISYIYLYAPLHDLGKLTIADDILLKEGPLTEAEFSIMKRHTDNGYELAKKLIKIYKLCDLPFTDSLLAIIRSHHEKMDGSGYPDGLVGDEIPIEVRIIAVADIFDALTSDRPYKKAWSLEDAFSEMHKLSASKLDSDCVNALISNKQKVQAIMASFKDKAQQ